MLDAQTHFDVTPLLADETTVGGVMKRIRRDSRDEAEKGRWFENLVMRVLREDAKYQVAEVHLWRDWPEREELTGLKGNDIGIDLVARLNNGEWVAIQCKCYDDNSRVYKSDIDSFLAVSQRRVFAMRWIVATCEWAKNAEAQIEGMMQPVRRIDFLNHSSDLISEDLSKRPPREPWPLQQRAIDDGVAGLEHNSRGRLIMACGTGKTFTALRISEQIVENTGGGGANTVPRSQHCTRLASPRRVAEAHCQTARLPRRMF